MSQQTLALVKPDGVLKGVVDEIRQRYIDVGLRVIREQPIEFDLATASVFYQEHVGKFFFEGLVSLMCGGTSVALLLQGDDAIERVRRLNGDTDPAKAEPGTIRRDFRSAGGPANTVHASDSPEAAKREIRLIFG